MKVLNNTTAAQAAEQVPDLEIWGNGDMWKLICKASSKKEGWMKSTKAMEIPGVGCLVQVTTYESSGGQLTGNLAIAEAVTFVPGVMIYEEAHGDGPTGSDIAYRELRAFNPQQTRSIEQ